MDSAHRRLGEASDGLLRSCAAVRSLAALVRNMRDETTERMAWSLGQLEQGIGRLLVILPHWIEYVPEEAMLPTLLERLSELDSLRLRPRLEEIEALAYADDVGLTAPAIATLATEFRVWSTYFMADLQKGSYFAAFKPLQIVKNVRYSPD